MSEKSAKLDLNVGKVGASFAFAALSAAWLPARVWAEDTLPGLWGNTETVVAEPYVGTPGLHTGQVVLSLLLVVGVLAALAWMLRRLQAQRPPVAPEEAQEQVLFCSRFNARQTLIVTEQIHAKLGPTIPEIAGLFQGKTPIAKESFSCWQNPRFMETLKKTSRRQILMTGIETHICVYQTALDLLSAGYEVYIVADAVSSRTAGNREVGLQMMRDAGGKLTCTEAVLFELLKTAASEKFKDIFRIVK